MFIKGTLAVYDTTPMYLFENVSYNIDKYLIMPLFSDCSSYFVVTCVVSEHTNFHYVEESSLVH